MFTDITMRGPNRVLIIDAKYYHDALIARHEDATKKIISSHLYQLYAYLSTWHHDHPGGPSPEGMLLYPTVCDPMDINLKIHGFPVRVVTIDLAQPWQDIADDLGRLLGRTSGAQMLPP